MWGFADTLDGATFLMAPESHHTCHELSNETWLELLDARFCQHQLLKKMKTVAD